MALSQGRTPHRFASGVGTGLNCTPNMIKIQKLGLNYWYKGDQI